VSVNFTKIDTFSYSTTVAPILLDYFFPHMPQFFLQTTLLSSFYFMSLQCYTLKLFVTKHLLWVNQYL